MADELYEIDNKLIEYEVKRKMERFRLSVSDLLELDHEIERLKARRLELTGEASGGVDKRGSRGDLMSAEIENAKHDLGDGATPADVMRKLKGYAGKQGSCITEIAPDGVLWRTLNGKNTKLTMEALEKRLSRRALKGR